MKKRLKLFFAVAVTMLVPVLAGAQAKVYTKKMLLADFPVKTTMVVLDGQSFLEMTLRSEIATRWHVSPYEFCTSADYEARKNDCNFYFLRLVTESGLVSLELTKGGKSDDPDRLRRPVDVVGMPVASEGAATGEEIVYMGAYVDVLQSFVLEAIRSDHTGYSGLKSFNSVSLQGKYLYLDEDEALQKYQTSEPDALIGVSIVPAEAGLKTECCKMVISADGHELFYFSRKKYKGPADAAFSDSEIKSFGKRHAIVVR